MPPAASLKIISSPSRVTCSAGSQHSRRQHPGAFKKKRPFIAAFISRPDSPGRAKRGYLMGGRSDTVKFLGWYCDHHQVFTSTKMVVTLTGVEIPARKNTGQPESCPASATIIRTAQCRLGTLTQRHIKRRESRHMPSFAFPGFHARQAMWPAGANITIGLYIARNLRVAD